MKEKVINYVRQKGWKYRERNGSVQLPCPFEDCDDSEDGGHHFYIYFNNEIYTCMKCGKRGHLLKLKRLMGDLDYIKKESGSGRIFDITIANEHHRALLKNKEAMAYLQSRGYTDKAIKESKVGYTVRVSQDGEEVPCIVFHTFFNDKLTGIKYKSIEKINRDGKWSYYMEQEPGGAGHLYGGHLLDPSVSYVIVVEGEYDRDSATAYGMKNVVSVPNGATGFGSWVVELDPFHKVYLMEDNDDQGDKGSNELAKKLGKYRCYRVRLPLKDLNECLCAGLKWKEIQVCMTKAQHYAAKDTISVEKAVEKLDHLYDEADDAKGRKMGFKQFNRTLAGFRDAEVTVITGDTAAGKTTFGLNIIHDRLEAGEGVLICSSEVVVKKVLSKLISIHLEKDFYDRGSMTPELYAKGRDWLLTKTLFFIDVHGEVPFGKIEDALEMVSRMHHVQVALLDHLHFFLDPKVKEYEAVNTFTKDLEKLVKRTGIHALLVVHPKQLDDTDDLRGRGMNFLRGSASIKQNADNVLILWRDAEEEIKGVNHVEVIWAKIRDDAAKLSRQNATCHFYFNADSQRYYERLKKKKRKVDDE